MIHSQFNPKIARAVPMRVPMQTLSLSACVPCSAGQSMRIRLMRALNSGGSLCGTAFSETTKE